MLSDKSDEVEKEREELAFYSNQCWDEIRRVNQDNAELLRDHFIGMSQVMCSYINANHMTWADFLSHFAEQRDMLEHGVR